MIDQETLGDRVAAERNARGMTQAHLAAEVTDLGFKISQQGIAKIEERGATRPKCLIELAAALGVRPEWLKTGRGLKFDKTESVSYDDLFDLASMDRYFEPTARHIIRESAAGDRDVPQWKSEIAPTGEWHLSPADDILRLRPEPLHSSRDAFACIVATDEAAPVYERLDIIFVAPHRIISRDSDCLFLRSLHHSGPYPAIIRRVTEGLDKTWEVQKFNPPTKETLKREDWSRPLLIVARYVRIK